MLFIYFWWLGVTVSDSMVEMCLILLDTNYNSVCEARMWTTDRIISVFLLREEILQFFCVTLPNNMSLQFFFTINVV